MYTLFNNLTHQIVSMFFEFVCYTHCCLSQTDETGRLHSAPMCDDIAVSALFGKGILAVNDKSLKPPYTSYRSFQTLIKELRDYVRDHQVVPSVIDRSLLSKRSGSEQSALIATLKWFGLTDDHGKPTPLMHDFIEAEETETRAIFKAMVEKSYSLITDGTFDLRRATTNQMSDRFRQYDISGSTLSKSISFFLAAAKEAGIWVSPLVKAPADRTVSGAKKKPKPVTPTLMPTNPLVTTEHHVAPRFPRPPNDSMVAIPIPIYGGTDGVIYLPGNMTGKQWANVIKMTEFILQNYRDTMADQAANAEEEVE